MSWSPPGRPSVPLFAAAALAAALAGGPWAADAPGDAGHAGHAGHADHAGDGGARGTAREDTALRQAPARDSTVLATVDRGRRVTVLCAAEGARHSAWYLVHTDHYAWAPAHRITVKGPPPDRC
ncbi:SH3 domain-containing protein [Streptomyces johnsoniae]|uniref:SH3 domain-containing protein n=1 Tax=Streptomyces johnsoniae TaxID=3075532 RepID=A0ABU2RXQ6_9ACTN|nr:SH3 domain-containing protein [Streptomyces sp. DSM 41886]MDT0441523.1 SH3 domain-containing protein [Streptomyces sp. DSM 41886]